MRIEIKDSAIENNTAVKAYVEKEGRMISVENRETAESIADKFSANGAQPIGVQKSAPQDPNPVELYLVHRPKRDTHVPIDIDSETWTFDTTANQYGAIGEAILRAPGTPAIGYFAAHDLDLDPDEVRISIKQRHWAIQDGKVTEEILTDIGWTPDIIAFANGRPARSNREYWCEVKTGNASFEREQRSGMSRIANIRGVSVLKIRLLIDELPKRYSVRFEKAHPSET